MINNDTPQHPFYKGCSLKFVYQDDYLLVLDKVSGLLSVPGRGEDKQDSLALRVQMEFPDALIVHRLDMATSGLIVMARDKQVHRQLSMQFQQRKVQKHYTAVVNGYVAQTKGEIDLPLIADWPNRPRQKVDFESGKPCLTRYKVLHRNPDKTTRVELEPVTGRTHQLRIHMHAIGHSILGDSLYANKEIMGQSDRLLLHANSLSFEHPATGEPLTFICETPF